MGNESFPYKFATDILVSNMLKNRFNLIYSMGADNSRDQSEIICLNPIVKNLTKWRKKKASDSHFCFDTQEFERISLKEREALDANHKQGT